MRSPIHRVLVLLVLLPVAFFQTQCTRKKADESAQHKPNATAAAAYAAGFKKQQEDDLGGAIKEYTKAIEADPSFTDAYRNRGDARRTKGDAEGAIADYTKVLELDPKNGLASQNRGLVRIKAGDVEGALADFTQTIALKPNSDTAYSRRGEILNTKGDFAGAIADFTKVIQLSPEDSAAYRGRADARFAQGDFEGAIADYTKSIELNPTLSSDYLARGLVHSSRGEWPKAGADFDKACQASPADVLLSLYRWVAQTRVGQDGVPNVRATLHRAHETRSGSGDWPMKIARYIIGDIEEAELLVLADSGGRERARDQNCQAWCYVGFAHLAAGKNDEAIAFFQKSVATDRKTFVEYRLAKDELVRLEGKK